MKTWQEMNNKERWDKWVTMNPAQQNEVRDTGLLITDLIGCEGWRIEAIYPDGSSKRFYVGRSTGWMPCHLEVKLNRSFGGEPVYWPEGTIFRKLYRKGERR
jgi:hypothetical protein